MTPASFIVLATVALLGSNLNQPPLTWSGNTPLLPPLTGVVNVLANGDSLTAGIPAQGTGDAWRARLQANFDAAKVSGRVPAGVTLNWVGPVQTGSAPTDHHNGVGGSNTQYHIDNDAAVLATYNPHVIINFTGAGDANAAAGATFDRKELTLVGVHRGVLPNVRHMQVLIPDHGTSVPIQASVDKINAVKPELAERLRPNVTLGSAHVVPWPTRFLPDQDHPDAAGNILIADSFTDAFLNTLGY